MTPPIEQESKMKRIRILLLPLALILLITAICSCASCQHRDIDDNDLCDKCAEAYTDGIDVAHSHTFGDWENFNGNGDVPCEEKLFQRTCTSCGQLEWRNGIYNDHNLSTTTVSPTCTEGGYDVSTCSICGFVSEFFNIKDPIPTNHTFVYGKDPTTHWLECIHCGEIEGSAEHVCGSNFSCSECGHYFAPTEGVTYEISEDNTYATVTGYTGNELNVVLSDEYQGLPVKSIREYAFTNTLITSIFIPVSVTSIGIGGVIGLNTTNITVSKNNPAYKSIDGNLYSKDGKTLIKYAVAKEDNNFAIPDCVTKIGDYAFSGCSKLTSIVIRDSVTSIGNYAFYNCDSLTSVVIPDSVTSIGYEAFYNCNNLTSIYIGSGVKNIGSYIYETPSRNGRIASVVLPTIVYDSAFRGCVSLSNICVDESNTAFESIEGNLYTKKGETLIQYATGKTDTSFTMPNSVTNIGDFAFEYCTSLTSVVIPDSVTSIGSSAFAYCTGLTSVVIPNSVTSIGDFAFSDCSNLTSVAIPDSVTSIGDFAFSSCSGLTSVVIPDSVTSIGGGAFSDCSGLTSVEIEGAPTIGESAFSGCNSALYTDYEYCRYAGNEENPYEILLSVTNANLSTYAIHEDTKIIAYGAFRNCTRLTEIVFPDSVTSIGNYAFYNCYSLTSVVIPDSVTSISDYAFYNCSSLTSVVIPDSVTSIGHLAFYNCSSLTSVVIPDSVTSIGHLAFYNCDSLTSVVIPDSVTSIGYWTFANCSKLTIYCKADTKPEGWNSSDWNPSNCPVVWGYEIPEE